MTTTSRGDELLGEAAERVIALIPGQRDREIIQYRFGLDGHRETLNEVGIRFGLTRERIRQVENTTLLTLQKLQITKPNDTIGSALTLITQTIDEMGRAARVDSLTTRIMGDSTIPSRGIVTLLAQISPHLVVSPGNALYHQSVVHSDTMTKRDVRRRIDDIVAALKRRGRPIVMSDWAGLLTGAGSPQELAAMASLSKTIIHRGGQWGLPQWAVINPHNIRDLAYILLSREGKPMHYSAIADAVNAGTFGRAAFSQKVVHNGLIKDPRFVLIGRGTYALAEWGYMKGSLPDVIASVLREESPLTGDEIVRRVMKVRQLQDRTIRLSLHTRPQFKRVAKAQYVLDEQVS